MNYGALIQENDSKFDLDPNKKTVMYIDFNNLFFRSYSIAKSQDLNPIHVLLNSVYALKTNIDHHYAFAIGDGSNNAGSRLEIYPEYKANREEKTEEEKQEISKLKEISLQILDILGICYHEANYIEADDIVGILSKKSINQGWNVIAVSSDKDYKQLCNMENFNLYNSMKKMVTTSKNIVEQIDLTAEQYLDYLILVGDKIDNVIGIHKVGDVTAKKWLHQFGSLDNVIISLVREGLIDKSDYLTPYKVSNIDDGELMFLEHHLKQPLQDDEPKLKNGETKNNLIKAIKEGKIDLNRQLIGFQYQHESYAIIPREKIKKPQINIEELENFCDKYNLKNFKNKYLNYQYYSYNNNQNNYYEQNKTNSTSRYRP